jgi:hypothetical protein
MTGHYKEIGTIFDADARKLIFDTKDDVQRSSKILSNPAELYDMKNSTTKKAMAFDVYNKKKIETIVKNKIGLTEQVRMFKYLRKYN